MNKRTALITGILGQDGVLLAELLLSRGYRVVGVARAGSNAPVNRALCDATIVVADLTDGIAVRALLEEWMPDEIYHLAAFHHSSQDNSVSAALASKEAMLATNFQSTKTLAFALVEAARTCHFVFAASSQMFTARNGIVEIEEHSQRDPSTFYGHTKSWSMDLLALLRKDSALHASGAILFNHESPLRGSQFVSRKITRAAAQAATGERPKLELFNIAARVDWSSAHDVVQALSLMGKAEVPGDYVVASGVSHSVRDLLELAFSYVDLDWREFTTVLDCRETSVLVGRTSTLEQSLGWQRAYTFRSMILEMIDHDLAEASQTRP